MSSFNYILLWKVCYIFRVFHAYCVSFPAYSPLSGHRNGILSYTTDCIAQYSAVLFSLLLVILSVCAVHNILNLLRTFVNFRVHVSRPHKTVGNFFFFLLILALQVAEIEQFCSSESAFDLYSKVFPIEFRPGNLLRRVRFFNAFVIAFHPASDWVTTSSFDVIYEKCFISRSSFDGVRSDLLTCK